MMVERLDRVQMSALLGVLLLLLAPHVERLPYWLSGALVALFAARFWLLYTQRRLPPRWVVIPLTFLLVGGVFAEYRTLLGKAGGVALLAGLIAMKLMETRARRDALLLVYLGYFLVITNFLFSQTMVMAAYLFTATAATTALLIGWHSLPAASGGMSWQALRAQLRFAVVLLLQAIPLMALLFVFFPRIEGPLWRMPQDRGAARSGLADSMSPGSFSSLSQNDEVAFRVSFNGRQPPQNLLYWRGPVFENYDGRTWTQSFMNNRPQPEISGVGPTIEYTITMEPHMRPSVLALDMPLQATTATRVTDRLQLVARDQIIAKRERYTLSAALDYHAGVAENPGVVAREGLGLPAGSNPQALALAQGWRQLPAAERINEALRFFSRQGLRYTLSPPIYGGEAIDDFLFRGKEGFCEHFASAFVFLMRAAEVPARVVGGYQGGDQNGDYLIVRQADAHAWAEVWLEGKGWVRVDPTFAVAPSRIERGLASALPDSELPMMMRLDSTAVKQLRLMLDAAVNNWNQWVIGYTPEQQRRLLQRFGIASLASSSFVLWFLGSLAGFSTLLSQWLLWEMRPRRREAASVQYEKFCKKLARAGVERHPAEGPMDFAARAALQLPAEAGQIAQITTLYIALRYIEGPAVQKQMLLQRLVRQFAASR